MMREFLDFMKFLSGVLVVIVVVLGILWSLGRYCIIPVLDRVTIVVEVNGEKVYEGLSYLCNVSSTGSTTKVRVMNDDWLMTPKAYYVSDNVHIYNQ